MIDYAQTRTRYDEEQAEDGHDVGISEHFQRGAIGFRSWHQVVRDGLYKTSKDDDDIGLHERLATGQARYGKHLQAAMG